MNSMSNKICRMVLVVLVVGMGDLYADVRLDEALTIEKNKEFGHVVGLAELSDGSIVAANGDTGQLNIYFKQSAKTLNLDKKIFNSTEIGGVSLAANDLLIVSNSNDNRFALVTKEGELVAYMGQSGSNAGEISAPSGIAYSSNRRIYIADTDNNRISVFGPDGVFIQTMGKNGLAENLQLREPIQIYVDGLEQVYVFENGNDGQISIFSPDGKIIKKLNHKILVELLGGEPEFSAMTIDKTGLIYLADSSNGRIYQIDWQASQKLSAFGSKGDGRGQFNNVTALLVLGDGRLVVADSENKKIDIYKIPMVSRNKVEQVRLPTITQYLPIKMKCDRAYRLDENGALCLNKDKKEVSLYSNKSKLIKVFAKLENPQSISIEKNKIAILDGERIKIFDKNGNKQFSGKGYAGNGSALGKLDSPSSIFIRHEKIYIADTGNERVQIFSDDGIYLNEIVNPKDEKKELFSSPVSIVVDAQGNIFVADEDLNKLHVFSADRKYMYSVDGGGGAENLFKEIYDLAIDADNNLYVLCGTENNKYSIHVYNGPNKIISFAAEMESQGGLEDPKNLTIANTARGLIGVYDKEKKGLQNFSYLQVPAKVGSLVVVGSVKESHISWVSVPGKFVKGYNVYGANSEAGKYEFVTQVNDNSITIKHNDLSEEKQAKSFYKVNAFSGLGSQGMFSRAGEDVFIKGYKLFKEKKYAEVIDTFKTVITENVEQPEALKYIGLSLLEVGRVSAAVLSFREMSNIKGYENEGANLQVKALVAEENYIAAKQIIDEIIDAEAAVDETFVFCGEISLKLGDPIGAVTCLEEAINRDDKNVEAHFLMGDAYVKLGLVDKGMMEFDKAAEIEPDNENVWYRSGLALQKLNKPDEAIKRFNTVLKINKNNMPAKLALAKTWLDKKEYAQVKSVAITLAGKKETAAQGQYLLGLVARAEGKNGEALLALSKSIRMNEKNAEAWLVLSAVYRDMGQENKIRPSIESAVKADALSFDAALALGRFEYNQQQYSASAIQLQKAVKLQGDAYDARIYYAQALYKDGDYSLALAQAKTANKLKEKDVEPIVLLSNIMDKQGRIGKSIEYMKQAMALMPESLDLTIKMGELYSENNLFDQAKKQFESAQLLDASSYKPYALLGGLFLQRRLFDESIEAYDKAISLEPSAENKRLLDQAYLEKKKSLDFKSNVPKIVLKDLRLNQIFAAAYKQYSHKPVGAVRIQNTSGIDYGNLKLTFSIKGYMDFPSTQKIPKLTANETLEIDLLASFNNLILEIDEDTGVQVEVSLSFVRDGKEDAIKLTQPMTIYGKNAIVWSRPNMIGSFVTPKDDALRNFVRQSINENKPKAGPLSDNLISAMTIFNVYSAHGIRYVVDPNSPYSKIENTSVDYVQFSRETLSIKSGDCDDLSVLMSASLENLGIKTAILDVPGHLLMMFDSGVSIEQKDKISLQENLMVEKNGNIWIPIEATMIGTSFSEAWAEGARKYYKYEKEKTLKAVMLSLAWEEFVPVTLKPLAHLLEVPSQATVKPLVNREKNILLQKSLDRLVKPYQVIAASHPNDTQALMQMAIIYAKYGLYSQANIIFDEILKRNPDDSAVHNNRGNIYYSKGVYSQAIEAYGYAEQLAANDPGIKINLAMSYYQLSNLNKARLKFNEAEVIDSSVSGKYSGLSQLLSR